MELHSLSKPQINFLVIGGGAAGFMAAITAAESGCDSICILESTNRILEKVRISGGGRCNVTNSCWDPSDLVENYPRGRLPLKGPFSKFATADAIEWFSDRGVDLKEEDNGKMFPVSNKSSSIVDCLRMTAKSLGITIYKKSFVNKIDFCEKKFFLSCKDGGIFSSENILLATGGHPSGYSLASNLGHEIIKPVPSLFNMPPP